MRQVLAGVGDGLDEVALAAQLDVGLEVDAELERRLRAVRQEGQGREREEEEGEVREGAHLELFEGGAVLADPGEDVVEAVLVEAALDLCHVVPQVVVDEVGDALVVGEKAGRVLEGRVGAQEVVDELVAEATAGPGGVLWLLDRVGEGGEVVDTGLSDPEGAVALCAEVGELALEGAHAGHHGVDAGEHVGALVVREGRVMGVEGRGREERGEVLGEGARRLEVVLVRLLGLLVDLAEGIERSLGA